MSWHATAQWRTAADTASRDEALWREAEAAKDGQLATQADEPQPNPQQPMEEPCTDDDWTTFLHPCDVSPATSPAFVQQVVSTAPPLSSPRHADNSWLADLVGKWRDARGSVYELTECISGLSLSVDTLRPEGTRRYTPGLVKWTGEQIVWGNHVFTLAARPSESVVWNPAAEHLHLQPFQWGRM